MKIVEINAIKVCDIIINENTNDKHLWNIVWCDLKNILTQKNGRCYYIVVDGIIYKIGYSDCDGGIKTTINSYKSCGNSGRPSDRTHGIHILITEQLLLGKKVEIYFNYNENLEFELKLMDGSIKKITNSISGKMLEIENMKLYVEKEKTLPIWNLQESGKPWPTYIQESRNLLLSGKNVKLIDIKKRLGI